METHASPPVRALLPASVLLMLIGWGGLVAVLVYSSPNGGTRWALFFTMVLALTGSVMPVVAFLNRRFPSVPPPTTAVIVRQALWFGIYLPSLAWLQLGRVLTPALAFLIAFGLVLIEWLLRMRERAQWRP